MITVLSVLLFSRSNIETTILRAGGTLYQQRENGTVSNLYNAEFVNKTADNIEFEMKASDPETKIEYIHKENLIKKGGIVKLTFFVIRPLKSIKKYKSEIDIQVYSKGKLIETVNTNFIAPPNL